MGQHDALQGSDAPDRLDGRRVAFVGRLGGMNRRQAHQWVRAHRGIPVEAPAEADLVVIGADELPVDLHTLLDEPTRRAAAAGRLTVLGESQFWEQLGLVESQQHVRRLYTPAMLAELLGVPVGVVRRWHRRGLIQPCRVVHRLPYFDFQEAATARRLAEWLAAGASPHSIERDLAQLAELVPAVQRPLAQLSIILEGSRLLLRQGEGLIEPGGQLRFDFEAAEKGAEAEAADRAQILPVHELTNHGGPLPTVAQLIDQAAYLEDMGQTDDAMAAYRTALMIGGPTADLCFRIAELLYQCGDLTAARERYSMAVELDEDFVEARANLGCVLAELGEHDLALAAFQGTLRIHPEYPDVHYHLARLLDDQGQSDAAHEHWKHFLRLAPNSPWAEHARMRLEAIEDK